MKVSKHQINNLVNAFSVIGSIFLIFLALSATTRAQSTSFTYQGNLEDSGTPANGTYDFEFRLFDQLAGGTQVGPVVSANGINVSDGAFTVTLDFGSEFPGPNRYIELRVKAASAAKADNLGGFTILSPRQVVRSVPYAIKSATASTASSATNAANADQLGGVAASDYVVTTDPRLTDARTPTAGSGDYIQNGTTEQASSNFSISGTGIANTFNVTSQYNINGERVLSIPNGSNLAVGRFAGESVQGLIGDNTFIGAEAGRNSTFGSSNTFAGARAGLSNTEGDRNVFIGWSAGRDITTGSDNVIVGYFAGGLSTTGSQNTFVGRYAGNKTSTGTANVFVGSDSGDENTIGDFNTFVGQAAGGRNSTAINNSFFGRHSGFATKTGGANTFIGGGAGGTNISGAHNTILGEGADMIGTGLTYATAIGSDSRVSTNNTIVLGRPADGVSMPGTATIGNITPAYGEFNINAPTTNADLFMSGNGSTKGINFAVDSTTAAGAKLFISQFDGTTYQDRLVINEFGVVSIAVFGLAGSTSVCRNASLQLATCSSSMRYKNNIENFTPGIDLIKRLRPVSFNWKDGGMLDLGLVAEEVAAVEPLLTTINTKGEVEGVKYDRVGVVLVNVVKEQQEEIERAKARAVRQAERIETLEKSVERQNAELKELKSFICSANPEATICVSPQK